MATLPIWQLIDRGDSEREDGIDGHVITCAALEAKDFGLRIYPREDDPLAHAAEIVAALNAHEARKAAGEEPRR